MTIATTAVGNGNILSNRIAIDMSEEIAFLEPSANPLTVLTKKLNTQVCHQPKYEWMDNDVETRWSKVTDASGVALDGTTVNVTTGTGKYFAADDLVRNVTTGEVFKVVSISTDALTITRGIGAAAGVAMSKDDVLLIIGNAAMQGTGAPAEKVVGVTAFYNYTQIFKTAFSITNTLDATTVYGMKELARLRKMAGIKHAKDMEYAFMFGKKSSITTGSQPVTTTEGIVTTLTSLATANNKSISLSTGKESDIMSFCENVFTYGGDTRTCLCSPNVLSWFANLGASKIQLIQSDMDKTLGLNVTKYVTPHGILNLILHPLLVQGYTSRMICLSPEDIYFRPLQGRDTKLTTNVQNPDEDGERDMYLTEAGVELRLPLKHGIVTFTA